MDKSLIDILWVLFSAGLVFMMQAGFLCLESGLTRAKNSINVAIKNLTDFGVSSLLFWLFGFSLMFGVSQGGWLGKIEFFSAVKAGDPWLTAFFLYHVMFCGTAVTIVSGAVAERMRFSSYLLVSGILTTLIYPVFGHWVWGGAYYGEQGWLEQKGFIDFAGSSVVHSVAGWVALAAVIIIGPRVGRFSKAELPTQIQGSNLPVAILGTLLLWLGWLGFNGGSVLAFNHSVPEILLNTVLAASAGMIIALALSWRFMGYPDIYSTINGSLAGLVSITANCHAVDAASAVIIGAVGSVIMLMASKILEKFQIDDVIGAVPVHLAAGIWGTMAVAIFGDLDLIGTGLSRWNQLGIQAIGVGVCGFYSFTVAYLLLYIIDKLKPLRVTPEQEYTGLNIVEHKATTGVYELLRAMEYQAKSQDLDYRVPVEKFTDTGQIAERYNDVLDALDVAILKTNTIIKTIRDGIITFARDGALTSFNPAAEKMFGYSPVEIVGHPLKEIFFSQIGRTRDGSSVLVESSTLDLVIGQEIEMTGKRKDGSKMPVELVLSRGKMGDEEIFTGAIKNIAEKKRTEEQIKILAKFPDSNPNPVMRISDDGIILYHNKASISFLVATNCKLGQKMPLEWQRHIQDVIQDQTTKTVETEIKGQTYNCQLIPIDTGDYVYFFAQDISSIKLVNKDLEENEKHLRIMVKDLQVTQKKLKETELQLLQSEKLKVIGRLAGGVAHEVKNPLAIILQGTEYLSKKIPPDNEDVKLTLKDMTEAINRADSVIKGLLDFSHLSHLQQAPQSIKTVVENSLKLIKFEISTNKIQVVTNLDDGIPDVNIDKNKMEQVFVNLFLNAIHAMQKGGTLTINALQRKVTNKDIGVGKRRGDPFRVGDRIVAVEVIDTGHGISEEHLEKIFEPFFTTKHTGKGTGLGLSVIDNIIDLHKGKLNIVNHEGGGVKAIIMLKP